MGTELAEGQEKETPSLAAAWRARATREKGGGGAEVLSLPWLARRGTEASGPG